MSANIIRPLYLVDAIVKLSGQEITFAYEDLVFIEHSEVLIQFNDPNVNQLLLHIHKDLIESDFQTKKENYLDYAKSTGVIMNYVGRFSLAQKSDKEEINITFYPMA